MSSKVFRADLEETDAELEMIADTQDEVMFHFTPPGAPYPVSMMLRKKEQDPDYWRRLKAYLLSNADE